MRLIRWPFLQQKNDPALVCCGRPITHQEIKQIQETVSVFSNLSRKELSQTICEHLNWRTAAGANKIDACIKMLEKLEDIKALQLPAKRAIKKPKKTKVLITSRTDPQPAIAGNAGDLNNVNLEIVTAEEHVNLWNEYVPRYHYLGYKKPFGYTMRYFINIDVAQIEQGLIKCIQKLIRNKKFIRYLIDKHYPIAIDGTQKMIRDYIWSEQCQERTVGKEGHNQKVTRKYKQYYVYVLEASLAFQNGMTIPLISEFLSYAEGDIDRKKQDCETKAFKRLAKRLKSTFKRLPIMLLLDWLYANGPVMEICRNYRWDYMIVLKDDSLTSVWREYNMLQSLMPENLLKMRWGNRKQSFKWVNNIEYEYDNGKTQSVHVVTCEESWEEVDKGFIKIVSRKSKHAWISSKPLNKRNIHERCNLAARHRWNIESEILIQKHHGYQYEHCFSYNWNAITLRSRVKGYHFLMRIGLMLNVLVQYSECFIDVIKKLGKRGTIKFIFETMKGPWFNADYVKQQLEKPLQLRLI